jgi:CheY-like chemotaxis protein
MTTILAPAPAAAGPRSRSHAPDTRVLVVDDDRDLRDTVTAALETEGYRVRCAENGAQALAVMHGYLPAAMVLDLSMPVMSGWELIEIVHEMRELRAIQLVVLSGLRAPAGVEHLSKPVTIDELLSTLDRLCP